VTAFARERPLTRAEAIELAKCVMAGKPSAACPIPFSYLFAAVELSRYLLAEEEIQKTETLPPPADKSEP
jgi:hypothetical protein